MSWETKTLKKLDQRDERFEVKDPLYVSYEAIVERLLVAEKKLELLQKTDVQVLYSLYSLYSLCDLTNSSELGKALNEVETLKEQNGKLKESVASLELKVRQEEGENRKLGTKLNKLEAQLEKVNEKLYLKTEEYKARNKALTLVNDDLLALQLENNLLNEKVKQLSSENDKLVQRWMNKVKEDAEKLNDANVFLEKLRLEKK